MGSKFHKFLEMILSFFARHCCHIPGNFYVALFSRIPRILREIFTLLYFHEFREFCLVAKLNFAKCCHAMPFMLPTWIIYENIFCKIIEITIFVKI